MSQHEFLHPIPLGSGLIFAAAGGMPEIKQTPEQQKKTLEFWSK